MAHHTIFLVLLQNIKLLRCFLDIIVIMDVSLKTDKEMMNYAKTIKYLIVFPDKSIKYYSTLRKIATDIYVDYTTISKKLGENNPCICRSQNEGYIFLIRKL